jgi:ABC-type phosphate/phosphonate transport system substrate-binding protein
MSESLMMFGILKLLVCQHTRLRVVLVLLACTASPLWAETAVADNAARGTAGGPLTMVVMDPLALPLSCPCVKGYAQRKYDRLADYLQQQLGRPVRVVFNESLVKALRTDAAGKADLVIGKDSVVRADAKRAGRNLTAVARLTGKDGATTQTGLIVVPATDPARTVTDLKGYRIIFGPAECDEKHAAALALLKSNGIDPPARPETSAACSDGATRILELGHQVRAAAVISSYAKPLLEGCGTIDRGALRVVAETQPVPFVTALVDRRLPAAVRQELTRALLNIASQPQLCRDLETLLGFVAIAQQPGPAATANHSAVKKK